MIPADSQQLFDRLYDGAQRIAVSTHINPDGDAIGSQSSLVRFLVSRGKDVRIINRDATPRILSFIEYPEVPVEIYDAEQHDDVLRDVDLIILVDNSAPDRLGSMESIMVACAEHTLCIDHHPARNAPWRHNIVDVNACATTAMVYQLIRGAGWELDFDAAQAAYVGLVTDTGCFRFNSTNADAHRLAAELLDLGVDPARTYQAVYERNPAAYTRLLGHALSGLRMEAGGALALVTIERRQIEALSAQNVDTSEMTTPLLAMDGVLVAVLFRELDDSRVKVSLRSKGFLDVHQLATEFGGGGHRNASGIVMQGELKESGQDGDRSRHIPACCFQLQQAVMHIEVRFFASLVERTGQTVESVEVDPSATVQSLWQRLVERHPSLADLGYRPLVACDRNYASWDDGLDGVREVAFLPPLSGG